MLFSRPSEFCVMKCRMATAASVFVRVRGLALQHHLSVWQVALKRTLLSFELTDDGQRHHAKSKMLGGQEDRTVSNSLRSFRDATASREGHGAFMIIGAKNQLEPLRILSLSSPEKGPSSTSLTSPSLCAAVWSVEDANDFPGRTGPMNVHARPDPANSCQSNSSTAVHKIE